MNALIRCSLRSTATVHFIPPELPEPVFKCAEPSEPRVHLTDGAMEAAKCAGLPVAPSAASGVQGEETKV